jgi:hypothetical protein
MITIPRWFGKPVPKCDPPRRDFYLCTDCGGQSCGAVYSSICTQCGGIYSDPPRGSRYDYLCTYCARNRHVCICDSTPLPPLPPPPPPPPPRPPIRSYQQKSSTFSPPALPRTPPPPPLPKCCCSCSWCNYMCNCVCCCLTCLCQTSSWKNCCTSNWICPCCFCSWSRHSSTL